LENLTLSLNLCKINFPAEGLLKNIHCRSLTGEHVLQKFSWRKSTAQVLLEKSYRSRSTGELFAEQSYLKTFFSLNIFQEECLIEAQPQLLTKQA